jgi:hypothetical protein
MWDQANHIDHVLIDGPVAYWRREVISVTEISYAALTREMLRQDFYVSLVRSLKCIGDADDEIFVWIDQFEVPCRVFCPRPDLTRVGDEEIRRFGHPPPSTQEPPTAVGLPQRAKRCAT